MNDMSTGTAQPDTRQPMAATGGQAAPPQRQPAEGRQREATVMLPAVDVVEQADGITLVADLPGVPRDGLQLRVDGETLTIEGDLKLQLPEGMQPSHAEVQRTRYRRAFTLSRELDSSRIDAEFRHGVLRLRIPKAEHAQPRRIEVRAQ